MNPSPESSVFSRYADQRALVVGDLMLDVYVEGRATRVSQEAPVLVVRQHSRRAVAGGAANVAMNLRALGLSTHVIGIAGDDAEGDELVSALAGHPATLLRDPQRPTTVKTRVLADAAHQVLRIDHESTEPLADASQTELLSAVESALDATDLVLLSDYQKGVLTAPTIAAILNLANTRNVPVVANAKPNSFRLYRGAAVVSLNQPETEAVLGRSVLPSEVPATAASLADQHGIEDVVITLGKHGLGNREFWADAPVVEVFDTAGAGDTAIATLAAARGRGPLRQDDLWLATRTAAAVVAKVGVAVPSPLDLARIEAEFRAAR